jgi:hypothetical protein
MSYMRIWKRHEQSVLREIKLQQIEAKENVVARGKPLR